MPRIVVKTGTRPPWVGLAAAVWVEFAAGNGYTFPLYSSALKHVLGFSQQQLTILGVANDVGESVGILPGIACNKFPPWAVLLFGALLCFLGYGVIWLALTNTLHSLPYWLLWITLCLAANSNAWFGTAVLVTNMRNFPLNRGTVSGILKGYVGISASIYTLVYSAVLKGSPQNLLLFLSLGLPVLCLVLMYFVRPCMPATEEDDSVKIHFSFTQAAIVLLALFLLVINILEDTVSFSVAVNYSFIAIAVVFMLSPLAIPVKMTFFPIPKIVGTPYGSTDNLVPNEGDTNPLDTLLVPSASASNFEVDEASDVETLIAEGEGAVKSKKRRPRRGEDFKFGEAFVKADFWLLWLVYFLGVGSGVTVLNNLAQIGIAAGMDDATALLSLFSFCNFVGRLGAGVVSERFVRTRALPRTIWMTFSLVIMVVAFVLYALAIEGTFYLGTALIGISYGVLYSAVVPTVSELFGLKHFGVIYNFMLLGNPIGALLFSGLLVGSLYDAEAARQGVIACLGPNCFRLTFSILAGVCGLGVLLSIILFFRIRPVYRALYAGGLSA